MRCLLAPSLLLALHLCAAPARAADMTGCTADQAAVVLAAFGETRDRTRSALELLSREPDGDLVRRWFGAAPRARVRRMVKDVAAALRPGRRPPISCGDARGCRADRTFAFVRLDEERITLCPRFFAADAATGRDSRFGILVHEVSHLVAGTRDAAYGPRAALDLARDHPLVAAKNADNLEYFVEAMFPPPVRKEVVRAKVPVPAR